MKKNFVVVAMALVISVVAAPGSVAAVKAGTACKKAGVTSVSGGLKFTCVKKGSKLVWDKGVAVKVFAPTASAAAAPSATAAAAGYTMEKVKANNSSASCWSVINGIVYDLTKWIGQHPGGSGAIQSLCGTDASAAFGAQHMGQKKPESRLAGFLLGPLVK